MKWQHYTSLSLTNNSYEDYLVVPTGKLKIIIDPYIQVRVKVSRYLIKNAKSCTTVCQ